MAKLLNEVGNRYGRLLVLCRANRRMHRRAHWYCLCNCGGHVVVHGSNLRTGGTKSCGCIHRDNIAKRKENRLPGEVVNFNLLFANYKLGAKRRGYEWALSKSLFKKLTKQNCYYCETEPVNICNKVPNGDYVYSGLDRVVNDKGYARDNVVPCCKECNYSKRTMTSAEYISHCERVARCTDRASI